MQLTFSEIPEGFFKLCHLKELKEGQGKRFFANDAEVAVFLLKGKVYAVSNACPHQHSAVIYDGFIEEEYVICPVHGWKFSLHDGRQPTGQRGLDSYDVIVSDNYIYVKVLKKELKW